MTRPEPRPLTVLRQRDITPNMRRITLGGPGYGDFPPDQAGAYIKLFIDSEHGSGVRTYTVRSQRPGAGELDVDFVLHGDHGLASAWAQNVQEGDVIRVGGPGPRKLVDAQADWLLFAGDMTALPAISANLELLPADARGVAFLEVLSEADRQTLEAPPGIAVNWVVNPEPGSAQRPLAAAVQAWPWQPGSAAVWVASEFETMRELRGYLRGRGVDRKRFYVSSYWKNGLSEDQHKSAKRADAEALGSEES